MALCLVPREYRLFLVRLTRVRIAVSGCTMAGDSLQDNIKKDTG